MNAELATRAPQPTSPSEVELRAAMLSVYYHSLGRRFEIRGAPAVLLPPEAQPMSLADALDTLHKSPDRSRLMKQATWTIARAVGPQRVLKPLLGRARLMRYPPELIEVLGQTDRDNLESYDVKRGPYRRQAHLFGSALVAAAGDGSPQQRVEETIELFDAVAGGGDLDNATASTGILGWGMAGAPDRETSNHGRSLRQFLEDWKNEEDLKGAAAGVLRLEQEIGLSIPTFIEEFADSVAFEECFPTRKREVLTVFPASSVTVQDAETLTTRVTVTALVNTRNFHCLRIGMDPQCWSSCSSAFAKAGYLADPFKSGPPDPAPVPGYYDWPGPGPDLLEEKVTVAFGDDASRVASFHNILNVEYRPNAPERKVDMDFHLHRCVKSRILWDERAGGILVDEGYARARPLGEDIWRVTVRKTLRFSDRTPYRGGTGWSDTGQLLNYLAPSMLSWWIESEMYSATCPDIIDSAKERASMDSDQAQAGAATSRETTA